MSKINLLKILFCIALLGIVACLSVFIFTKQNGGKVFLEQQSGLQISARILSNKKFNSNFRGFNYFKNRNIRNKYKALKIDIKNDSDNEYLLEKDGINLTLEEPLEIEKKLKTNFALVPLAIAGVTSALLILSFGLAAIPSVIAGTAIGASTNLIDVEKSNKKMRENIKNRSYDLVHGVLIGAHASVSKIFFMKKENQKTNFNIKLLDVKENNHLNLDIKVGQI